MICLDCIPNGQKQLNKQTFTRNINYDCRFFYWIGEFSGFALKKRWGGDQRLVFKNKWGQEM